MRINAEYAGIEEVAVGYFYPMEMSRKQDGEGLLVSFRASLNNINVFLYSNLLKYPSSTLFSICSEHRIVSSATVSGTIT